MTTGNGVPVRVGYVPAYELHGNVCVSASLCYAGGFSDEEVGGVFPIVNGRPSSPIAVTGRVYGIGCARGVCTFASAQVLGVPLTQGRLGTIRDGHVVTDVEVGRVSTFFNDVTVVGSTYTAIGLIPTGTATVIVSGPVGTTP